MILKTHLCIEILYFSSNKDPIQLIQYCLKAMKKTILFLCFTLIQIGITCRYYTWYPYCEQLGYPCLFNVPKDLNKYLDIDLEEGGHGGEGKPEIKNEHERCDDSMNVELVKS